MDLKSDEKKRARILRCLGYSLREISLEVGVAKSSVSVWTRDIALSENHKKRLKHKEKIGQKRGRIKILKSWEVYRESNPGPLRNLKQITNRKKVSDFFETWTDKSAYVFGLFAADGCMYRSRNGGHYNGGYYIEFTSIDLELLEVVRKLIGINNKIERKLLSKKEYDSSRKKQYKLRIVNKQGYRHLLKKGFEPAKSFTLEMPQIPVQHFSDFVRGYFDGDGHVYFGKYQAKDRKLQRSVFQSGFTSGSFKFLQVLQGRLCEEATMGSGSLHANGSCWELSYSTQDSIKLYEFMYQTGKEFCLRRKRHTFRNYLLALRSQNK